jgi:hypothetical protein
MNWVQVAATLVLPWAAVKVSLKALLPVVKALAQQSRVPSALLLALETAPSAARQLSRVEAPAVEEAKISNSLAASLTLLAKLTHLTSLLQVAEAKA